MKKTIHIVLILLILITLENCKQKTTINKNLFVFSGNTINEEKYTLKIEKKEENWWYDYKHKENIEKDILLQLDLKSKILKLGNSDYKKVKQQEFYINQLSNIAFKKYELVQYVTDGTGPVLFNMEYGILGIRNIYAPDFVFLPKKGKRELAEIIRKKLVE